MRQSSYARAPDLDVLTAALENAGDAIVITDRAGNVQWVNPAFAKMTGYAPREAVENAPGLRPFGDHAGDTCVEFWRTVLAGRRWCGRLKNRRKDGSTYEEDVTVTPVVDTAGQLTRLVAIHSETGRRQPQHAGLQALAEALRQPDRP